MKSIGAIFRRELAGYFVTPVAYVFLVIFLALMGALTFYFGGFYERGQADLGPFFGLHPWLYAFLVPALAGRFGMTSCRSNVKSRRAISPARLPPARCF